MSFHPAVEEFSKHSLLTIETAVGPQIGVNATDLPHPRTITVKQITNCSAAKIVKKRLPRARKARARLRKQNRLRAHVARNN